jgi:hypothetical protein
MRHLIILIVHLITTVLRVVRPGGVRAAVAESILTKRVVSFLLKVTIYITTTCTQP